MATRIIATIWKKPFDEARTASIIRAGASMLRIKCAHDTLDDIVEAFGRARKLIKELGAATMLLADLPEAKTRLGDIGAGKEPVESGKRYVMRSAAFSPSVHDAIPADVEDIGARVAAGDRIIVGDGIAFFAVREVKNPREIIIEAQNSADIARRSGVTLPNGAAGDHLTDETWDMCKKLRDIKPEYLAFSFVDSADMMRCIREKLADVLSSGWRPKLVAKIENASGVANAAEIAKEADALMVARGDLALATPIEKLAVFQKNICRAARDAGAESIVATAILDSMEHSPFPSRPDVCDLAAIAQEGADWAMLCRATAHGEDPGAIVEMARRIIAEAERVAR